MSLLSLISMRAEIVPIELMTTYSLAPSARFELATPGLGNRLRGSSVVRFQWDSPGDKCQLIPGGPNKYQAFVVKML